MLILEILLVPAIPPSNENILNLSYSYSDGEFNVAGRESFA